MPSKSDPGRLYWDSSVFLRLLSRANNAQVAEQQRICATIWDRSIRGEIQIITSALAITEVLRPPRVAGPLPQDAEQKIHDLFEEPQLVVVTLDPALGFEARELSLKHQLSRDDAIHLASALRAKVDVFHTYDGTGMKPGLMGKSGTMGSPPLKIAVPGEGQSIPMHGV
jgi:predicted nucleic acid-binding protein